MANALQLPMVMFAAFEVPVSWGELFKRTAKDTVADDCLGQAAQLAYYFFLALFPAVLFVLALVSFLPITNFIDQVVSALRPIAPPEMVRFIEAQLRHVANADSGGILTIGILGAVWSSSAALVAIISSLNRAYDIEEGRAWWKVRLIAIGLTLTLAAMVLIAFTLVVVGPRVAEHLAVSLGLGATFEWTWKVLQWPVAFFLVSTGLGLVYYFAPDAEQEWVWVTPGAVLGTALWVLVSLAFKFYVANFADYNATYGAVGSVVVLLLWFYISGLALLVGAEMNAEIEHASPYGKEPGEKVPGQKKKIGIAAARAYKERLESGNQQPAQPNRGTQPVSVFQGARNAESNRTRQGEAVMIADNSDRTLGEMFAELVREARTLIDQEIQLAKTEMSEKASSFARCAILLLAGGLIAYAGLLAVIAALVLVLVAFGLPPWAAAILGGVLTCGLGYLFIRSGIAAMDARNLTPRKTLETLKEDAQWLQSSSEIVASAPTSDDIRAQIEQTRAEMGETIDAIHARLRPGQLVSSAKDRVKAAAGEKAQRLVDSHPVISMTTGFAVAAVAILLIRQSRQRSRAGRLERYQ